MSASWAFLCSSESVCVFCFVFLFLAVEVRMNTCSFWGFCSSLRGRRVCLSKQQGSVSCLKNFFSSRLFVKHWNCGEDQVKEHTIVPTRGAGFVSN